MAAKSPAMNAHFEETPRKRACRRAIPAWVGLMVIPIPCMAAPTAWARKNRLPPTPQPMSSTRNRCSSFAAARAMCAASAATRPFT